MNVNFKNDLENNRLVVEVSLKKRQRVDQKLLTLRSKEVIDIVNNQYTAPEGYTLGECLTKTRAVCNDFDQQLSGEWYFVLLPKKTKQAKKPAPAVKKATAKKTTTRRKRAQ